MSITISAWAIPLAITIVTLIVAMIWADAEELHGNYSFSTRLPVAFMGWLVVTLISWLIWALLK